MVGGALRGVEGQAVRATRSVGEGMEEGEDVDTVVGVDVADDDGVE
jgi:hypothetical protein